MSNIEKAIKLYEECQSDPKVNILMPFKSERLFDLERIKVIGILINAYAIRKSESDFLPVTKENFYIGQGDKQAWKDLQSSIYRLEKKSMIESTEKNGQNWIRLINDEFYNSDIYKRNEQ